MLLSLDGIAITGTDDLIRLLGAERIGRETSVRLHARRQARTNVAAGRRARPLGNVTSVDVAKFSTECRYGHYFNPSRWVLTGHLS